MKEKPTYQELLKANKLLSEKVRWLEGVYHTHRDAGSQVQSRFLSNITHEIRTPMNAIHGFSELLQTENVTEKEREEYVKYISLNSRALLKVMDNIIDLTLLETNNLELKKEEVLVEDMIRLLHKSIQNEVIRELQYPLALLVTMPRDYKRIVLETDGRRLQRLIDSVVVNTITMQKKGVIELKLEIIHPEQLRISVISEKNGLLAERAEKIFEKSENRDDWFNYLDHTGMTYKLAREVVQEMGGLVSLVNVSEKRMGLCIDLPVSNSGIQKKIPDRLKMRANYLN